jgi:hypothetical protein
MCSYQQMYWSVVSAKTKQVLIYYLKTNFDKILGICKQFSKDFSLWMHNIPSTESFLYLQFVRVC